MKKIISIISILTIILSAFIIPAAVSAESLTVKTMMQFKYQNLTFEKNEDDNYECKIENNDEGFIKVQAYNEGEYYWLTVETVKPTNDVKPTVTITDSKDGSVVRRYEFTVTPAKKIAMKNCKFNTKTTHVIRIKNPYIKSYKLKYDKKLLTYKSLYIHDGLCDYTFFCRKMGTTNVKASIKGILIGSFKVTVGNYKASVKNSFKKSTIQYNKHIMSYDFSEGGSIDIADAVKHFHMDAKYTVSISNKKIAASRKLSKDYNKPSRVQIYSLKPGKTDVTVYEQKGKSAKKKIGKIKLTVVKVKDFAVVNENYACDNDGLFYEFFVCPGDEINLKKIIVDRYINGYCTTEKFKKSDYTINFKVGDEGALEVDDNGIVKILGYGNKNGANSISYKIMFSDGSMIESGGSFSIVSEDFFD